METNKILYLKIHEIRIDEEFIENIELIDIYLFECQCALFLVDITNENSFNLIKKLINIININKYPYLKPILVLNKIDLEMIISKFEIKKYLENNKIIDNQEISVKNGDNIIELIKKINIAVNESNNKLSINFVSELMVKKPQYINRYLTLILIGDTDVGKTAFISRYLKKEYREFYPNTIGIDKEIKYVKVGNYIYKLTVWDTAGAERFNRLPKKYYQNADSVLLFFDVTNKETFENVPNWIKDIENDTNKILTNKTIIQSNISLNLIGNKIDSRDRVITRNKAEELANSLGVNYFEVSCKYNMNISEAMNTIIMEYHIKTNHFKTKFFKFYNY